MRIYLALLVCILINLSGITGTEIYSQDTTTSLAFRKNSPRTSYPLFYRPDLAYKLYQQFSLIRIANSGDPLAQHELGLRYLQGIGTKTDTSEAAFWIGKAAEKELASACYNYGILLLNGWGIEWDPFKAFLNFKKAAEDGMPQAQYITGIFYTDNLVVKKDLFKAFEWLNKSHESEYEPAKAVLNELKRKLNMDLPDSSASSRRSGGNPDPGSVLVYIDFDAEQDTSLKITPEGLADAVFLSGNKELIKSGLVYSGSDSSINIDSIDKNILEEAADAGCPEAITLMGYMYSTGRGYKEDPITGGVMYYRAAKLESRQSIYLLWELAGSADFMKKLESEAKAGNPDALYLLYGLSSFNLTNVLSEQQQKEFLFRAADLKNRSAVIESGLNIYSSRYPEQNQQRGIEIIKQAILEGDLIAAQRYISILIIDSSKVTRDQLNELEILAEKGSILAESLLGYCYANSIGVEENKPIATRYLRSSAHRGSRFAMQQLESIYNSIRPADATFSLQ